METRDEKRREGILESEDIPELRRLQNAGSQLDTHNEVALP